MVTVDTLLKMFSDSSDELDRKISKMSEQDAKALLKIMFDTLNKQRLQDNSKLI